MPTFEKSIDIGASRAALFALTQDYSRRLQWDPFLKQAQLIAGAERAAVGVRAWCVSTTGLGMETEYVSFNPPARTAIKMTRGPRFIRTFAGSWLFEAKATNLTRVTFRYHLTAQPRWLGFILSPMLRAIFADDTRKRLEALKHAAENTGILQAYDKGCA
jgi:ribosome-associated toxin RatA of RatAB toxin-antitoxin module